MSVALSDPAAFVERLRSFALSDGSWPYYRGSASSVEPTLLAALALSGSPVRPELRPETLSWIRQAQNRDGSFGIGPASRGQGLWLTALGSITLDRLGLSNEAKLAANFLLSLRSVTGPKDPRLLQDDRLTGWPWVPGTFGWVEPTAWAVLALALSGQDGHPRCREGVRFLLDREIPSGGWNYGNPALDGKELLPFWDTTGLALIALHGLADPCRVEASLELVGRDQRKMESLSGLAWAALALQAYGLDAAPARTRLQAVMSALRDEEFHVGNFSLGLIALSEKRTFSK